MTALHACTVISEGGLRLSDGRLRMFRVRLVILQVGTTILRVCTATSDGGLWLSGGRLRMFRVRLVILRVKC